MFFTCAFATLLQHPASPVRRVIVSAVFHRVDISDLVQKKVHGRAKYISQFGPGWKNYKANLAEAELKQMKEESRKHIQMKDGKPVEGFRYYKGLRILLGQ